MPERHLIVTPLPNGRTGNIGRLSVMLSPRLRETGVLGDYPDMRDWANVAGSLSAQVILDGVGLAPTAVTRVSPPPDQAVWRAVFGPPASSNLLVRAFTYIDRRSASITTMDSAELAALTDALYRAIAATATGVVSREAVEAAARPLLDGPVAAAAPFLEQVGNGEQPAAPEFEFHGMLRMLAAHPHLLRLLGLVMDLEVDLGATVPTEVQVRTSWAATTGAAARDEVPLRMSLTPDFEPVVGESTYRTGRWLRLGGSNYAVAQGFSLNAVAQMEQLGRQLRDAAPGSPVDLPALEDGGLSIIVREQAERLQRAFERQRLVEDAIDAYIGNTAGQPPLLQAEDVQTGFRVDVEDVDAPTFRSLYRRRTDGYEFPRNPNLAVAPPADEGWGSLAMFTDGTPQRSPKSTGVTYGESQRPKSELSDTTSWRLDDHLITWSGWSLTAPRPTRIVDSAGQVIDRPPSEPVEGMEAQVVADYEVVPGTLPKLRYGHAYRFHARCVDLGGSSPALPDGAPPQATSVTVRYGRTMPVPAPTVVRRASRPDPGIGDEPVRLVIKSELNQADTSTASTFRCLFPPSIPQQRLEQHGLPAGGVDPGSYAELATRDALRLADQCIIDPDTGEPVAGAALQNGAVTSGPLLQDVDYLADPAGRAVAFIDPPQSPTPVIMPWGTWPTYRSVTLELAAGTTAPTVDAPNQQVTFRLPKGTTRTVRIASALDPALLPHFKWFQLLTSPQQAAQTALLLSGQVGMFSPVQSIQLVHAVRLPLEPPSFPPGATATRTDVGQTTAVLDGPVNDHGPTSERLTIRASWTDPVDDVTQPGPTNQRRRGMVGDVMCNGTGTDSLAGLVLDLRDNRRHRVDLDAEAFCRYSQYFTEAKRATATVGTPITLITSGVSGSSVVVRNRTSGRVYEAKADYTVDAAAGTVTPRASGAIPTGTPLEIQYLRSPYSRRSAQAATGKKVTVDVPASARPAPPEVDHALPAFARTVTTTPTTITVRHDGRLVRVYLRRPWYSSGAGEMLGVACDGDNTRVPYTTWSRDVTTAGTGPFFGPFATSFPRRSFSQRQLDGRFDVAAHTVTYDTEQRLWVCDIAVSNTPVYRPFLDLVVCRYQPLAIDGEHLSETVALDSMRLGADRTVRLTKGANGINVRVSGPDNTNQMWVTVQQADPAITDPELRWTAVGAPLQLTRTGTPEASVHSRTITVPASGQRRLLVEDLEPVRREVNGALVNRYDVAYREVVELPATW